jgi:hypothetical protein
LVTAATKRRSSRKGERGTTVVVVVMVTTLITAIGVFAVRNISQIDQAVGYSRQSAQTTALVELGATAAIAELGVNGATYADRMSAVLPCMANGPYMGTSRSTCYLFDEIALDAATTGKSGETLLEPAIAGTETGSFGPLANAAGFIRVEMTERHHTNVDLAGVPQGTPVDVTLTAMASVMPRSGTADPCANGVASMSVQKVMRAHIVVPPL